MKSTNQLIATPTIDGCSFTKGKGYPVISSDGNFALLKDDFGREVSVRVDGHSSVYLYGRGVFVLSVMEKKKPNVINSTISVDVNVNSYGVEEAIERLEDLLASCREYERRSNAAATNPGSMEIDYPNGLITLKDSDGKIRAQIGKPGEQKASAKDELLAIRKALRIPEGKDAVQFCEAIRMVADCWIDSTKS